MSLDELTTQLREKGVRLQRRGDNIAFPEGYRPPADEIAAVREHKVALVMQLHAEEVCEHVKGIRTPVQPSLTWRRDIDAMTGAIALAHEAYDRRDLGDFRRALDQFSAAARRAAQEAA